MEKFVRRPAKMIVMLLIAVGVVLCLWLYRSADKPQPVQQPTTITTEVSQNQDRAENSAIHLDQLRDQLMLMIDGKQPTYSIYVKPLNSSSSLIIHNNQIRAASMIKLFIMAEVFRQVKYGQLDLSTDCVVNHAVKVGGSGSLQTVPDGTHKTVRELLEMMITESDNTATNMVIDLVGMDSVNRLSAQLGCTDTLLQRKMMDVKGIKAGRENYTSVADLGLILEKIYLKQCVGEKEDREMFNILLKQEDNDKIPALLPAGVQVAHKTGELVGAVHDGGIVLDEKQNYIVCIMTEDVRNVNSTTQNIAELSRTVYQFLNRR